LSRQDLSEAIQDNLLKLAALLGGRTRTRTWDPLIKSLRLVVCFQRVACKRSEFEAAKNNGLKRDCKTCFVCNQIRQIRSLLHGTIASLTGVGVPITKAMPQIVKPAKRGYLDQSVPLSAFSESAHKRRHAARSITSTRMASKGKTTRPSSVFCRMPALSSA